MAVAAMEFALNCCPFFLVPGQMMTPDRDPVAEACPRQRSTQSRSSEVELCPARRAADN